MIPSSDPKSALLIGLLFGLLFSTALLGKAGPGDLVTAPIRLAGPAPPAPRISPGLGIYFTDPTQDTYQGGPETGLVAAVDGARAQVDIAAYDLDLWGLRDALIAAQRRGVLVRLVVEADHLEEPGIAALLDAGIPVAADLPEGLMHNKFVIIDRRQIWTGSMNFTLNGAYRNDNNLVALTNTAAAAVYQAEFEEMFLEGLFGAFSPAGTGASIVVAGPDGEQVPVEILFSPDDGVQARLLVLLDGARESVRFMAFSFTSDALGDLVVDLHRRGIDVQGVLDESQLRGSPWSEFEKLMDAGVDVRVDGSVDKLHHKVIVIDGRIVVTGSYNFSDSAETRNDENVLILFSEEIAGWYLEEFQRVYAGGR